MCKVCKRMLSKQKDISTSKQFILTALTSSFLGQSFRQSSSYYVHSNEILKNSSSFRLPINAISFNLASPSKFQSNYSPSPNAHQQEVQPVKPDPGLRERWVSSFARTTITMTPFQTFPAASASTTTKPATPCLSETISKLKHTLMWGQGSSNGSNNGSTTKLPTAPVVERIRPPTNGQQVVQHHVILQHQQQPHRFPEGIRSLSQTTPCQIEKTFSTPAVSTATTSTLAQNSTNRAWPVLVDPRFSSSSSPKDSFSSSPLPHSPRSLSTMSDTASTCSTPRRDNNNDGLASERILRNRDLLFSSDERFIKTSVTVLENLYSRWCAPMVLPRENLIVTSQWDVRASCKMDKGTLYVQIIGPCNINRPFSIPFSNIFASSRSLHQKSATTWPPTDEMLAQCDDLSRWELDMCIDPYTDIKATVTDPWKKAYLLTIPVKLIKQKNKE